MLVSEFLEAGGDNFSENETNRQADGRRESCKVPKFVEFRKELPEPSHGKVSRRELE